MNEPVIVLDDLSKSYGDVHAVQNLSLTIAPGTIFGFLGPNGAGKTTTMRMLCGLTHPDRWQGNNRRHGCLERSRSCSNEVRLRSATL